MKEQAKELVYPFLKFGMTFYEAQNQAIRIVKQRIERLELLEGSEKLIESEYKLIETINNL